MAHRLDASYWDGRYRAGATGWDIGAANRGLVDAVVERVAPSARILIPGAGRAHEALALWRRGYRETTVLDWSAEAIAAVRRRVATADVGLSAAELDSRLVHADFFAHDARYDVIVEQTFFCAIDPELRPEYVERAARLLAPAGRWIGVLFDREFPTPGPPFGGTRAAYERLFRERFVLEHLGPNERGIAPRSGSELFGVMRCRRGS